LHFDKSDFNSPDGDEAAIFFNKLLSDTDFQLSRFAEQLALGTGAGLRYNLGFLVIRIDWGLALHVPYTTSRSRYFFNWDHFRDAHALHFAIGYPF
jgi:hypothetical protein